MMDTPEHPDAKQFYEKGMLALNKQAYDYAAEFFQQVLRIDPDFPDAAYQLRYVLRKKALPHQHNPLWTVWRGLLCSIPASKGRLYEIKGDISDAVKSYEKALLLLPNHAGVLLRLANLYLKNSNTEMAMKTLEEILQVNQRNITALKLLGQLYIKVDNYIQARACYEKVLKMFPNDTDAARGLKNLDALGTIKQTFGSSSS